MKDTEIGQQVPAPSAPPASNDMGAYFASLNEIRRARLSLLIEQRAAGNVTQFAEDLGYSRSQMYQFLSSTYNEGRSVGELAARLLEQRAGLQFGWLDQAAGDTGNPVSVRIGDRVAQLVDQRDDCDAARASTLGQLGTPAVPAVAGSPSVACIMPALYPHEVYAGVVSHGGAKVHLILLPGDVRITGIEAAEEFAASVGGTLPTRAELMPLFKRMRYRFKPGLYYTCDKEEFDGHQATVFCVSDPEHEHAGETRARAVRRVLADPAPAGGALTEQQVADMATRLIDAESLDDDDDSAQHERLVSAGIKLGIARMAMEVQKEIAARARHAGGAHA